MKSLQSILIIVEFISVVVYGNLITLDGQCPFDNLKPTPLAVVPVLKGKFNIIAKTAMNYMNRTDMSSIFKQTETNTVKITDRFRDKDTGNCTETLLYIKPSDQPGVYEARYQVTPDTGFEDYLLYFLSLDLVNLRSVGIFCRNLPNFKYSGEIAVISGLTKKYDKNMQEYVKKLLIHNKIEYLNEYLVEIENNNECDISAPEFIDSLLPSKESLLPGV